MAHGINTTIVEIDPVVMEYAVKYFDLAPNHHAVIDDAVHFAEQVANDKTQRYDYIIHDVFTGGAEPIALFTDEFLRNLHRALKPDGVIAIVSRVSPSLSPPPAVLTVAELRLRPPPAKHPPRHPHRPRHLPFLSHLPRNPHAHGRRDCRRGPGLH